MMLREPVFYRGDDISALISVTQYTTGWGICTEENLKIQRGIDTGCVNEEQEISSKCDKEAHCRSNEKTRMSFQKRYVRQPNFAKLIIIY